MLHTVRLLKDLEVEKIWFPETGGMEKALTEKRVSEFFVVMAVFFIFLANVVTK
jgi:hypothetical protein